MLAVSAAMFSIVSVDKGPAFHAVQLYTFYEHGRLLGYSQQKFESVVTNQPLIGSCYARCTKT